MLVLVFTWCFTPEHFCLTPCDSVCRQARCPAGLQHMTGFHSHTGKLPGAVLCATAEFQARAGSAIASAGISNGSRKQARSCPGARLPLSVQPIWSDQYSQVHQAIMAMPLAVCMYAGV